MEWSECRAATENATRVGVSLEEGQEPVRFGWIADLEMDASSGDRFVGVVAVPIIDVVFEDGSKERIFGLDRLRSAR
jgi:hypothetical protein